MVESIPNCPRVVQEMIPFPLDFNYKPEFSPLNRSLIWRYSNNKVILDSLNFSNLFSKSSTSVIKPSVVTETTLPPKY